eukprot:6239674-Prymnesium_polylepis.1
MGGGVWKAWALAHTPSVMQPAPATKSTLVDALQVPFRACVGSATQWSVVGVQRVSAGPHVQGPGRVCDPDHRVGGSARVWRPSGSQWASAPSLTAVRAAAERRPQAQLASELCAVRRDRLMECKWNGAPHLELTEPISS